MAIKVQRSTFIDHSLQSLNERLESVLETFLKSGYKIVAVTQVEVVGGWSSTIFYSTEA